MLSSSVAILLALGLGGRPLSPPAPIQLWSVKWAKRLVLPESLDWKPRELGGAAVDQGSGIVVTGTRDGVIHALNYEGDERWAFRANGPSEAPPLIANGVVYAGNDDGNLYALDLLTGKELWRYGTQEQVGTTPVLAGGLVLVSTLQDTLFAVDAKTGEWKWHHRRESSSSGFTMHGAAGPAVAGGVVFTAYSDGYVSALDVATGQVKWERRVSPAGDYLDIDSTPQIAGSRIFVASCSGAVYALEAATGKTAWEFKMPGAWRLELAGDRLIAVGTSSIAALAASDGKQIWTTRINGAPGGDPVAVGNLVLVPTTVGMIWLDARNGQKLKVMEPGSGVSSGAAVRKGRVFVLSNAGELLALDLVTP